MRDDFISATKDTLARRVGMRCSNPNCRKLTSGPRADPNKAINIGVAAHITAASPNGPRYDDSITQEQRTSINNGIWLCQNCAKLVDSDSAKFTEGLLHKWKENAETIAEKEIQGYKLSGSTNPPDLCFVTEMVSETDGGFKIQFSLANSSSEGQINVFNIVPVLIFRHYLIRYYEIEPHALRPVMLRKLRLMQKMNAGELLTSSDGIFGIGNLIQGKTYRLPPHEMDTFTCQFLVPKKPPAIWAIGLLIKFSDSLGNQRLHPSDSVFTIQNDCGFSLAQYDLQKLENRLSQEEEFEFYEDVTVGFDGTFQVPDESEERAQPDDNGVVHIEIDPDDMYEIIEGIPCDWSRMFSESIKFLHLETDSWEEMEPA